MPKHKKKPQQQEKKLQQQENKPQQQEHKHDSSCNHEQGGHSQSHGGGADQGGHSHSHGGGHDHDHSHSHGGGGHDHEHSHSHGGHDHEHSHSHGGANDHNHGHSHGGAEGGHNEHAGGHSHGHGNCDHDHGHGHSHEAPQQPYVDPLDELSKRLASSRISTCASIAELNSSVGSVGASGEQIVYTSYTGEDQMKDIMALIEKDLSEPYTIFTYRYFISDWPSLCILAMIDSKIIGVVVCKLEKRHRAGAPRSRGYIAMLAVDTNHRKLGIGSRLVREAIYKMILEKADEVVLETEIKNQAALALYETLGFIRDKRLHKYYLNGGDAFRLVLPLSAQFLAPAE